jgi:plastocyanin
MTKLISGRIKKTPSANVSASRYDFIKLSETEPDLGVPAANGYVLSGNVDGRRAWILPTANLSATSINALADVDTATFAPILGYGLIWNGTNWVPNVITVSSTELSNVANTVLGIVQSSLVANTVLTLSNFTTANLVEGTNLYFTNARVYANVIGLLNAKANVSDLTTANVRESTSNLYYTNVRAILNIIPSVTELVFTTPVFNYNIDQYSGDNPAIYVSAGETISFALNQSGAHPLAIRVSNGGSNYNTGLTHVAADGTITTGSSANGKVGGKLFWKIPYSLAGSTYVYQCTNHSSMVGNIVIQKPVSTITTTDVVEGNNLYFTNARVYSNVISLLNAKANVSDLTTANVAELNNLYFTNARVYSNVLALLPTLAGDNILIAANGRISANAAGITAGLSGSISTLTGNISILGNLSVRDRIATNILSTNSLIVNGFEIFSNNDISVNKITSNVSILGNITANSLITYGNITATRTVTANSLVTNSLIVNGFEIFSNNDILVNKITSNVSILGNITANSLITYGNITATGTVTANTFVGTGTGVPTLSSSSNIILSPVGSVIFYNNMIAGTAGNITGTTTISTNSLVTNSLIVNGYELFSNNDITVNKITANIWTGIFTANVTESASNLYFTNARVYANVIGLIGNKANVSDLTTANIIESTSNLYFTNARVYSNVLTLLPTLAGDNIIIEANGRISATGITSIVTSVVGALTTANVTEVASNLYYTNTRSRAAISAGAGILYDPATGVIASLQNTSSASNVTFAELNVTGNVNFYGNVTTHSSNNLSISDNMIYLNSGSSTSNPDLGFAGNYNDGSYKHTGFFRDATDGVWKVFDSYTPEPDASQFIDTGHGSFRLANLSATAFIGNVVGTVSSIGNFSTTSLSEGTNLYYTNARVASNVIALLPVYNGAILASNVTTTNLTANTINVTAIYGSATGGSITGADLISANNITATNITASYIVTGSGPGGSLTGANLLSSNNVSSLNWIGLYASNVIENGNTTSGNVFFSNAKAIGAFVAGSGINIAANGQISASASSSATSIVGLNTANVSESASNLYFTNTRAIGAFVAGSGINIAANGQISASASSSATSIVGLNTANVSESASNLYYTNVRVYANVVSLLTTYTGNISAGNISTGGATGGFITGANLISANNFVSTGGTITGANLISANTIITTNITTGNLYTGTGSGGFITGANLITSNNITVTNLTATNLNIIGGITDNSGILSIATTGGTNANIELTADGTGRIGLDGMYWPNADGTVGQVLQTSGTGDLSWATPSAGGGGGQTQLSITNSQILSGGNQNYTLSNSANSANTVLITINGLVQAPITDYTISGLTGLVFAANTPANATIEVKTFGYSAVDPNDVILKQLVRSASYAFSRIFY